MSANFAALSYHVIPSCELYGDVLSWTLPVGFINEINAPYENSTCSRTPRYIVGYGSQGPTCILLRTCDNTPHLPSESSPLHCCKHVMAIPKGVICESPSHCLITYRKNPMHISKGLRRIEKKKQIKNSIHAKILEKIKRILL